MPCFQRMKGITYRGLQITSASWRGSQRRIFSKNDGDLKRNDVAQFTAYQYVHSQLFKWPVYMSNEINFKNPTSLYSGFKVFFFTTVLNLDLFSGSGFKYLKWNVNITEISLHHHAAHLWLCLEWFCTGRIKILTLLEGQQVH